MMVFKVTFHDRHTISLCADFMDIDYPHRTPCLILSKREIEEGQEIKRYVGCLKVKDIDSIEFIRG